MSGGAAKHSGVLHPFCVRLRSRRIALGLSQSWVAGRLGVQQSTVSDWESGETSPMLTSIDRWAAVLGYNVVLREAQVRRG